MPKACNLPSGRQVSLEDLPIEIFEQVCVAVDLPIREWYVIATAPLAYPRAATELLKVICQREGEPPPKDGYLTWKTIDTVYVNVDDDLPSEYEDGRPLPVAAEDDPATTG